MTVSCKYGTGIQSFGNSIPAGALVTSGRHYPNILTAVIGGVLENRAIGGTTLRSITQQGYSYHSQGSRTRLVTWDGPINDLMRFGTPTLATIEPALDAFLASAFASVIIPASHSSVAKVGAWAALGNSWGGKAYTVGGTPVYTSDGSASLTLNFTGDRIAITSYLTEITNSTPYRDLNVSIDGSPNQVFQIQGKANPGEVTCAAGLVFRGLGLGAHTIKVTPTSAGRHTVVDSFIVPSPTNFAPVLVSHSEYMNNWTQYGSINTMEITDQANAIISAVVAEWADDRFPVEVVRINDFYSPSTQCNADGIHPNDSGHSSMSIGYLSHIKTVP